VFPVSDVIPSRTFPFVTIALIVINSLVFLYMVTLPEPLLNRFVLAYSLIPAYFSWTNVFTSMFLHGGWLHVIGNMVYLWIFGDNVEDRLGHVGYLVFYLAAGAVAAMTQVISDPAGGVPMLGASGAIAGVMGAYFVLYPHSRVLAFVFLFFFIDLVEVPAIFFLGVWFLMQLFSGVGSIGAAGSGGTAFWAHVGGFVAGVTVGGITRARRPRWIEEQGGF
jgi:rhomboid family protein